MMIRTFKNSDTEAVANRKRCEVGDRSVQEATPIHPGETLNEEFLIPMKLTRYRLA